MSTPAGPSLVDLLERIRALSDRSLQALPRARVVPAAAPLDLRIAGRVLLHSGLVGLVAGALGAVFFAALELAQRVLLEGLGGLEPLRAGGERVVPSDPNM